MKQCIVLALAIFIALCADAQTLGDYRSNGNVNFTTTANWQVLTALPATWTAATTAPAANTTLVNSNVITVRTGNTITYNSNFNFASNTDFTINIIGPIASAGSFTVGYGNGQSTVRIERNANYTANNIFQNHTFRNLLLVGTGGTRAFSFSANLTVTNSLNIFSGTLRLPAFNLTDVNLSINSAGDITVTGNQTLTRSNLTVNLTGNNRNFDFQGTLTLSGSPGSSIGATFSGTGGDMNVDGNLSMNNSAINVSFPDNSAGNEGQLQFDGDVSLANASSINLTGAYAELHNHGNNTSLNNSTINLLSSNQRLHVDDNQTVTLNNTSYIKLLEPNGLLDLGNNINFSGIGSTNYVQLGSTSVVSKDINQGNNYSFPIGTATNYLPVTVNSSAGGGNRAFTVGVFQGATTNAQPAGASSYKPPIVDAIWNVQVSGNNPKNVTLNFGWQSGLEGSVFSGLTNPNIGYGAYNTGTSSWNNAIAGTANNTSNTFTTGTVALTDGVTNSFAIAQLGFSLPLLTRNFTAAPYNGQVKLNWVGVATHSSAHFEVERSADGKNQFKSIATIPVSQVGEANYSYADANPLKPESHYRIKITDEKGKVTYTRVLKVNLGGAHFSLDNLYPTLATSQLNLLISSTHQKQARLSIIDQQGRIVMMENLSVGSGSQSYPVSVSRLAAGQYILLLNTGEESINSKFIKQ